MLGLAADAAGLIYAVDTGNHCVWRIDPATAERPCWIGSINRSSSPCEGC
jgi:hypothetical protein